MPAPGWYGTKRQTRSELPASNTPADPGQTHAVNLTAVTVAKHHRACYFAGVSPCGTPRLPENSYLFFRFGTPNVRASRGCRVLRHVCGHCSKSNPCRKLFRRTHECARLNQMLSLPVWHMRGACLCHESFRIEADGRGGGKEIRGFGTVRIHIVGSLW